MACCTAEFYHLLSSQGAQALFNLSLNRRLKIQGKSTLVVTREILVGHFNPEVRLGLQMLGTDAVCRICSLHRHFLVSAQAPGAPFPPHAHASSHAASHEQLPQSARSRPSQVSQTCPCCSAHSLALAA